MSPDAQIPQELSPGLKVLRGQDQDQIFPVSGERLVIGRRRADITLHDLEVSGTHAELVREGASYRIRDLGSTNGTFVNGQQVADALLRPGDELGLGKTVLVWEVPNPAASPVSVEMPLPVQQGSHFPLGLYEGLALTRGISLSDDPASTEGLEANGTALLDFNALGVHLALPLQCAVQLEFVAGAEQGRMVSLSSGNIVIGRYGTDVVVNDTDVSRRHTALDIFGRDQIFLRDLGSTNGTYRNGERVMFCRLQSGDTLVLGRTVLHLVVSEKP